MLTYDISERGNLTIYEYLYRCIKDDIIKGRLSLGEKLPSKRKMAQQHQISLKTVENAYEQLLMEGYISAREKSGYYVMEAEAGYEPRRRTSYTAMQTGSRGEEASNITIDLTSNRAAIEKFPYDTWAKVMRGILSEKENVLLDTVPFAGVYELRVEIARYLYEYRGMDVEPEQIIIGAGTEYLYGRLLQLLGRNSIYAIEDPGYHRFSRIYHANDLQWCYVEIDEDGIVIDSLKQSGANVVHVSPGHHFPTGIIMPAGRRQELLAWTQEELGRYIIEDDYDRHIHRMKNFYRNKRDKILEVLKASPLYKQVEILEKGAGNHFLMRINTDLSDTQLKWAAAGNGIQISCLSEYCESDKDKYAHILIVNYSDLEENGFRTAVEVLSQIIS